jgi:hypothetical protein
MTDKYYTPEISEFHVGFEYEYVRVKHLDREDIESLGWVQNEFKGTIIKNEFVLKNKPYKRIGDNIKLYHYSGGDIHISCTYSELMTLFRGTLKNKSELKRLMVQLGIGNND